MRKHSNRESVLQGNFCDVVNFFRGRDIDDVDRLAQRALTIIMSTDHLVQTGDEENTDPFCANMFASSALGMLNEHLTTYPFVREPRGGEPCQTTADEDAVFASAEEMIEMAEGLMWPEPILDAAYALSNGHLVAFTEGFKNEPE